MAGSLIVMTPFQGSSSIDGTATKLLQTSSGRRTAVPWEADQTLTLQPTRSQKNATEIATVFPAWEAAREKRMK
eukprot:1181535-Rhodomonas_salina.2